MTVSQPFVHLHVHSHFSFARGVDDPERLCRAACERGMDTLAVTDTNGVYGLVWFQLAAKKYGIRPIHGAQLVGPDARAVVLARDAEGYRALCRALTQRHRASGPTVGSEPPRRWDSTYSTAAALADLPASAALLIDNADLLERLLRGGHSTIAGRLTGAFRNIGRNDIADNIIDTMKAADYTIRESDSFESPSPVLFAKREPSPYVARINLMWQNMREVVLAEFPEAPGIPEE